MKMNMNMKTKPTPTINIMGEKVVIADLATKEKFYKSKWLLENSAEISSFEFYLHGI